MDWISGLDNWAQIFSLFTKFVQKLHNDSMATPTYKRKHYKYIIVSIG